MPQQQSPWLETAYGWAYGENGWNAGMDSNLLKFSVMFDRNIDSIVASLPPAVNGQVHYNTADNRLYFAVNTTYFSTVVPKWFTLVVRSTGATWQYNGTTLVEVESVGSLATRLDAVELTLSSLGSAAFEDVSAFATQAELDVVEGQAQAYTDTLRLDLYVVSVHQYTGTPNGINSNQAGIEAAVSAALAAGSALYWPAGTYVSDANIPNLHAVRHVGSGVVKRGVNIFHPEPATGETNSIYCDPVSGNDASDGLDPGNATATRARLFAICKNYGGNSPGAWNLYFGAGSTQERFDTAGFTAAGGVNVYGPDVAGGAPTAILSGNSNTINPPIFGPYGVWNIYDIEFNAFAGHCVVSNPFTVCSYYNCRGVNGTQAGVNFEANSRGYLYGGQYSGNVWGARFYSQVTGSVRTDPRTSLSTLFSNNSSSGFQVRENSNVRADDFTATDNAFSAVSVENSRVHLANATLDNSPIGVLSSRGASWLDDNTVYGSGIITPYAERSGALELSGSNRLTPSVTAFTSASVNTGTTLKTTARSVSLPARYLNSNQKIIKVRAFGVWTVTGAAVIGVDLNTSSLTSVTTPSSGSAAFDLEFVILARGASSQHVMGRLTVHNGTGQVVRVSRTVSTADGLSLNLFSTLANAGDSITFDAVEFEYLG